MRYFTPLTLAITDSNIAESEGTNGTIYPYDITIGYEKGIQRYSDTRLYETFTKIEHLANFRWDDIDPLNKIATNLHLQSVIDSTSVVISISDVVYVHGLDSYYQAVTARTVDFNTEDFTNTTNWSDLTSTASYRHEYQLPEANSIYWKDLGATNRNKCVDKAINAQSHKIDTSMWFDFTVKNINTVTLFNLEAESVTITLYTTDINNPLYINTKSNVLNTTNIVNWRTLSQYEKSYVSSVGWTLPFFTGEATIKIELNNTTSSDLKLGEILVGQGEALGITLDGIPVENNSSGKIVVEDNGDVIFQDEGDITKVYDIYTFNLKFDSYTVDSTMDKCKAIINRRIVVSGEDSDDPQFRSLVVYGFSRKASPNLKLNGGKSDIKIQVQRFI